MRLKVAIIHNDEPNPPRYEVMGEQAAVLGVLDEVEAVCLALTELGHDVVRVPLRPPLEQAHQILHGLKVDVVFNLFEGFGGRPETEVDVARILAEASLASTGSPASALSLALDKARTKAMLREAGVATPECQLLTAESLADFRLEYPCIVKPSGEDASHGITEESVVHDFASLRRQVETISTLYGGESLVEEFIDGREFNTTLLGNDSPVIMAISEISYTLPPGLPRLLTFAAKWQPGTTYFEHTRIICPAQISASQSDEMAERCLKTFKLLGCQGYARIDMRLDARGRINVLEVNPNPDISPDAGASLQAQAAGMSYNQLIQRIVSLAQER